MDQGLMWVPPVIAEYALDVTWADGAGNPSSRCDAAQERAALPDLTLAVFTTESVDDCMPADKPEDYLCPASAVNLPLWRCALEKPGALGSAYDAKE
ncbi:MAG: hypothetical protein V2B18_00435 [Pseudomonadota bacterium]